MIILDTNVVSEAMRGPEDSPVLAWLAATPAGQLAITATTVAEVSYGIARMPAGARRVLLSQRWEEFEATLSGRLVALGMAEARAAGEVLAVRESRGRRISSNDAQIAGCCLVHAAVLATRNARDFEGLGIDLVDPWTA